MSLLTSLEQTVRSCKAEQSRINDSIQLYRGILQCLTPQTRTDADGSECADAAAAAADTAASPREQDDMDLLERALAKALHVRTEKDPEGHRPSKLQRESGTSYLASKNVTLPRGNQKTIKPPSKSTSLNRKGKHPAQSKKHTKTQSQVSEAAHQRAVRKPWKAWSVSSAPDHDAVMHCRSLTVRSSVLSDGAAAFAPFANNSQSFLHADEAGGHSSSPRDEPFPDQMAEWKSLRRKENRLWDKVIATQSAPEPGRSHFVERMRATFAGGHSRTDESRALEVEPTHPGRDLSHHWQTEAPLWGRAQSEVEARDQQRPEGGCPCPPEPDPPLLPPMVTYSTERELLRLDQLRMRVALLQQDLHLEQALLDALSPLLSSVGPGSGRPPSSVLRDLYSLLGEGGERYPITVLDSEPD